MKTKQVFTYLIVAFCLISKHLYSQQKLEKVKDNLSEVVSQSENILPYSLITTDINFYPNNMFDNSMSDIANYTLNIKKIGHKKTFEDILNDYKKAELNKYFFKGYNMWDISMQKETDKQLKNKNN